MKKIPVFQYDENYKFIKVHESIISAAKIVGKDESSIRFALLNNTKSANCYWTYNRIEDNEIIKNNVRLVKEKQKLQDLNRVERKSFREYARVENAIDSYSEQLIKALKENTKDINIPEKEYHYKGGIGVLQLSDTHFNELIDLPHNKYDFTIASKRLQKFISRAKHYFLVNEVHKVLFIMTGDLLNSDRRLDEILSKATNRANASMLAFNLIKQAIIDLSEFWNIEIAYVVGNESRIQQEQGWTNISLTDNYDSNIFNMLKIGLENNEGLKFIIQKNPFDLVLNINNLNVLFKHGHDIKQDSQKSIQQIIGHYASKGVNINYVIFGHVHFTNITDLYARSGSLCGSNSYSERSLSLSGRAAQNIHLFQPDNSIETIKIDLQNADDYEGYYINDDLDCYDVNEINNSTYRETIIKIVI